MTGKVAGEAQGDCGQERSACENGDPSMQSLGTIGRKTGSRQEDWKSAGRLEIGRKTGQWKSQKIMRWITQICPR